jgi:two-component system OmpR family response regulator
MRVLLVEDNPQVAERLVGRLTKAGFVMEHALDAEFALTCPEPDQLAALIVDLGLPGIGGLELIERWRARGLDTPILILSARGTWQDKVGGLNAGGDDYVVKPVHAEEVIARLHALVRRSFGRSNGRLTVGALMLDPAGKTAWVGDKPVTLTQIEFKLLHLFMLQPLKVLSQAEILDHLYGVRDDRDPNTIEVHVGRLRRKIGKSAIITVRGLGYRLEHEVASA